MSKAERKTYRTEFAALETDAERYQYHNAHVAKMKQRALIRGVSEPIIRPNLSDDEQPVVLADDAGDGETLGGQCLRCRECQGGRHENGERHNPDGLWSYRRGACAPPGVLRVRHPDLGYLCMLD